MKVFLVFLILIVAAFVKASNEAQCNADEQYYDCIPDCTNTCENYPIRDRILCPAVCRPGCFCKPGLLKQKDGKCVPLTECKTKTCAENEVAGCEQPPSCLTCENRMYCPTFVCDKGCVCKQGHYRHNGRCIPEEECPATKCPKNEVYSSCGPLRRCQMCNNRGGVCMDVCYAGCVCKKGYYRLENMECVPEKNCPANAGNSCPPNEVVVDCAKPKWCNTCGIQGNCKLANCSRGCDCKEGHYRDGNGFCIHKDQCPDYKNFCPPNEEVTGCPSPCSECRYLNGCPIRVICRKGCDCKQGFARNSYGHCVRKQDCDRDEKYSF